jgi:hypothetical protein
LETSVVPIRIFVQTSEFGQSVFLSAGEHPKFAYVAINNEMKSTKRIFMVLLFGLKQADDWCIFIKNDWINYK